ncbi:loricrin, putative [Trichomonas vaginalis G3]|uniref:receptor protein-tyrosine kinase n=1 Tax=Trichomonas vaginalis (strain ATCC PRA-98 / G3) TaxID=412133 RepID=A2DAH9_TRIV3|nr:glycine-rich protein family [Trichomonas vaginalis G3]EAY22482.1 loricrin, putative [Trichomonas vaginalis G3]KAI5497207.1 glycine-rich protein family [Trichomonas vaginalis G3]|eukprot:XP_001583468.1 loricrin [Trichomonas vaginalis G3]
MYPCKDSITCTPIQLDLKVGKYYFEVYGAAGGNDNYAYYDAYGGYAALQVSLLKEIPLFLYIGGKGGMWPAIHEDAFNGGGWGGSKNSGGGATDFRSKLDELNSRFLIAGGGGGAEYGIGESFGGGLIGGNRHYTPYSGANQTHPGTYREGDTIYSGSFGSGFSQKNLEIRTYPGGGGGLYGGSTAAGGSGFVYTEGRLTTEIMALPPSIKVDNPEIGYSRNTGYGYAIITSLSQSECKCVQKCFCSNERLLLRNVQAVPFMYSYLFKS